MPIAPQTISLNLVNKRSAELKRCSRAGDPSRTCGRREIVTRSSPKASSRPLTCQIEPGYPAGRATSLGDRASDTAERGLEASRRASRTPWRAASEVGEERRRRQSAATSPGVCGLSTRLRAFWRGRKLDVDAGGAASCDFDSTCAVCAQSALPGATESSLSLLTRRSRSRARHPTSRPCCDTAQRVQRSLRSTPAPATEPARAWAPSR